MTSLKASDLPDETRLQPAQCESHGPFDQRVMDVLPGMAPLLSRCPACVADAAAAADAMAKRQASAERLMTVKRLTGDSGIPPRFRDRTFASYAPDSKGSKTALSVCRRYAQDFAAQSAQGRSLVLTGGPGTGKTHLACAVGNQVIEQDLAAVRFVTVSEMLRCIKETYRKDATTSESDVIAGFVGCDLLIVDEIGVQVGSEHEKLLLFEVLNGRYQNLAPTILISNLSADELEKFLGHRVMDRYRECGVVLAFDWESYRGRRAA